MIPLCEYFFHIYNFVLKKIMKTIKTKLVWLLIANLLCAYQMSSQSQVIEKCIEFDFCSRECNQSFNASLKGLNLKKGDFFAVKIKNINPYRYNISVSTKHDTIKMGNQPELFTGLMDVTKLGDLIAKISESLPKVTLPKELESLGTFGTGDKNDSKLKKLELKQVEEKRNEKIEDPAWIEFKAELIKAKEIYDAYQKIETCYYNSSLYILNKQVDCFSTMPNKDCFLKFDCNCVTADIKTEIDEIIKKKAEIFMKINELTPPLRDDLSKAYEALKKELLSSKYSSSYLNAIHAKAYSNYLIAENIDHVSNYYTMPIQVQGDFIELKIDITPKAAKTEPGKKEEKSENKSSADSTTKNINNLNNQTPFSININTADKAVAKESGEKDEKDKEGEPASDVVTSDALKITMPEAVNEWHLSYKCRTNNWFFGVGSGFFIDWLQDEKYANKPVDPLNTNTQYILVKENNASSNKYGVFSTINVGRYWNSNEKFFTQLMVGPGITIEKNAQPRLLIGLGIGGGDQHQISLNGGLAFGQVQKLSNAFDLKQNYAVAQENIYFTSIGVKPFIAVNYVFNIGVPKN
jgi:hypothetical protein